MSKYKKGKKFDQTEKDSLDILEIFYAPFRRIFSRRKSKLQMSVQWLPLLVLRKPSVSQFLNQLENLTMQ